MRPTNLLFKHPNEKTGEFALPNVICKQITNKGNALNFKENDLSKNILLQFPKEKRFDDYKFRSQITGPLVGPGTYNDQDNSKKLLKKPCFVRIKKLTGINKNNTDSYIMAGNHLAYQPIFYNTKQAFSKTHYFQNDLSVDIFAGIQIYNKHCNHFSSENCKNISSPQITNFDESWKNTKIYGSNKKDFKTHLKLSQNKSFGFPSQINSSKEKNNSKYIESEINQILGISAKKRFLSRFGIKIRKKNYK